jgi:hypothetical protein
VGFEIQYFEKGGSVEGHSIGAVTRDFVQPFDLSKAPLLRIGLVKRGEEEYILMVDMHHIVTDALSNSILVKEIVHLYQGEVLPELKIQYKDFSEWQNKQVLSGRLNKQEEYWLREFSRKPPDLRIPIDFPRKAMRTYEGKGIGFEITHEEAEKLREFCKKENATMFMVALALFDILLYKITFQEELIVGTVAAGRRHSDLESIIGFFINTLALRSYVGGNMLFIEFLREVRKGTLDAFDNQDYQFEDLVEKVMVEREPGRNPLFDVMFSFTSQTPRRYSSGAPEQEREEVQPVLKVEPYIDEKEETIETKFDMLFTGRDIGNRLFFNVTYSTQIFKKETIEKFIEYFKKIVSEVVENESIKLKDIKISHDLGVATSDIYDNSVGIQFEF